MCENIKTFARSIAALNTIKKIVLTQFKNYGAEIFNFIAPITCITGANGSGKTNLLDAVYYLCYTKSYFSAYQQYSVQNGTDGFRIEGFFEKENDRVEVITCKWKGGKKEIAANGTEYERLTDHIGKYAAVMIAPDDMELINDGSEMRRKWIDSILSQTHKPYLESLMQYQRVLQQRNAWLKMHAFNSSFESAELEYYNNQLAHHGGYIYERRKHFLEEFTPLLENFYHQLSSGKESIGIIYESDLHRQSLIYLLKESLPHDLRLQRTLRGIHKDDFGFTFNEVALKQFGSQGQKKSYLFASKLAQYAYLTKELNHFPILLLDDIFEKLDQNRMEALLRIIRGKDFGQVILTDTHAERIVQAFGAETSIEIIKL